MGERVVAIKHTCSQMAHQRYIRNDDEYISYAQVTNGLRRVGGGRKSQK